MIDIEDLVLVDTDDVILITKRDSSEKVKDIVTQLEEEKRDSYL